MGNIQYLEVAASCAMLSNIFMASRVFYFLEKVPYQAFNIMTSLFDCGYSLLYRSK